MKDELEKRDEKAEKEKIEKAINAKLKHIRYLASRKKLEALRELDSSLSGICDFYSENSEEELLE